MIILDENVEAYWIQLVKKNGHDYLSIGESHSGISDQEVVEIAKKYKGLLITEDKDFGELVFSHGIANVSILFMRYDQPNYHQIEKSFLRCIDDYLKNQEVCFITITKTKIRYRKM